MKQFMTLSSENYVFLSVQIMIKNTKYAVPTVSDTIAAKLLYEQVPNVSGLSSTHRLYNLGETARLDPVSSNNKNFESPPAAIPPRN